jgi:hypothetical protein
MSVAGGREGILRMRTWLDGYSIPTHFRKKMRETVESSFKIARTTAKIGTLEILS